MNQLSMKQRMTRTGLIVAVAAAIAYPLVSDRLNAADPVKPAPKAPVAPAGGEAAPKKPVAEKPVSNKPAAEKPASAETATPAPKMDPEKVIATAGSIKVTAADFEGFLAGLPPQVQSQVGTSPETRRMVAEELLKIRALAAEAEKRKLDEDEKYKTQIANIRAQLLAQTLVSTIQSDEAADQKYFDEHPDDFDRIQARHILISTRPSQDPADTTKPLSDAEAKTKADAIKGRLDKGEDFAKLAKAESDDPGSGPGGGDLGLFGRGQMVPPFEEAAYKLKINEISPPVKSPFGYHIIQLQKREAADFSAARSGISRKRVEAMVAELTGGKTELDESFFGAAPAEGSKEPAAAQ